MKKAEPWKVTAARQKRAKKLADAFLEWQTLANLNRYPDSLVGIAEKALVREYGLGRKAGKQ